MPRTAPFFILLLAGVLSSRLLAADLSLIQESSASAQIQTVQATGYAGTQQTSLGAQWTLGLDWDHLVILRGGLMARSVQTSPVVYSTVYPGYLGWGWVGALDYFPFHYHWIGATWAAGLTVSGSWEYLSYPGLFREFTLGAASAAVAGEVIPPGTDLAFHVRIPVAIDQRGGFSLAWRIGVELGVVFRGVAWSLP